jgi:hypothetical protein
MLSIADFPHRPADIKRQIARLLIENTGGPKNFRTFDLGPGLKVQRRRGAVSEPKFIFKNSKTFFREPP